VGGASYVLRDIESSVICSLCNFRGHLCYCFHVDIQVLAGELCVAFLLTAKSQTYISIICEY
jgi:hypothetical protein